MATRSSSGIFRSPKKAMNHRQYQIIDHLNSKNQVFASRSDHVGQWLLNESNSIDQKLGGKTQGERSRGHGSRRKDERFDWVECPFTATSRHGVDHVPVNLRGPTLCNRRSIRWRPAEKARRDLTKSQTQKRRVLDPSYDVKLRRIQRHVPEYMTDEVVPVARTWRRSPHSHESHAVHRTRNLVIKNESISIIYIQ